MTARVLLVACSTLFFGGCASRRPPRDQEAPLPSVIQVPAKAGEALFFEGAVLAKVSLVPAGGPGVGVGGRPAGGAGRSGEGGGGRGGPPGESVAMGEFGRGGGPGGRMRQGPGVVNQPAVRLTLTLVNQTDEPVEIAVNAFDSALGNFAVRPERLQLEARGSDEPDPMISRLGVTTEEVSVRVTLVRGNRKESQTVVLRTVVQTPPEPSAPPAAR